MTQSKIVGGGLSLRIDNADKVDKISLFLLHPWRIGSASVTLVESGEVGRYEHEFESEEEWLTYKSNEKKLSEIVARLDGTTLATCSVNPQTSNLTLTFSNGYNVESTNDDDGEGYDPNWYYENTLEDLKLSVTRTGVDEYLVDPGEIILQRDFSLEKDGQIFRSTVTFSRPTPLATSEPWNGMHCAFEIVTPFGKSKGGAAGIDSVQALQLALQACQGTIDQFAERIGAIAFHLKKGSRAVFEYPNDHLRNDLGLVHTLLGRIYNRVLFWNQSVDKPEVSENLSLLKETLDQIEALQRAAGQSSKE
ncbi:MAG: hypothetical protein U0136_13555 [Bdellovibrionota bacterium]